MSKSVNLMATKYKAVHQSLAGPGDARPTAYQIIEDERLKGKWSDTTVLITGVSSGIGIDTAKSIYETGAEVYVTARDLSKAKRVFGALVDSERFHLLHLDLNSLDSVRQCVDTFLANSDRLNILINNAGVMATPDSRTVDGFETQFGTNHLAHFLLAQLLLPILQKSVKPAFRSRIIFLSSSVHRRGEVNFSNLNMDGIYDPWKAYAQSKTANIWSANEIDRRFGGKGVHSLSVHPGGIQTGLQKELPEEYLEALHAIPDVAKYFKNVPQGAATTVWAATAEALEGQGGKYLEDCQIGKPFKQGAPAWASGYETWAYDEKKEMHLWEKSMELLKPWLS